MSSPLAFLSFDLKQHDSERALFLQELVEKGAPFTIDDCSAEDRVPVEEWNKHVRGKIGRCQMMIVLIGNDAGASRGLTKEIEMARSCNVPFFGVYVEGTDKTGSLPTGLARNRVIQWSWDQIEGAITQLSKEGKNSRFV
jgi:hypothetical protein